MKYILVDKDVKMRIAGLYKINDRSPRNNSRYTPLHEAALRGHLDIVKFIYSEKATKFCEISTVDLTVTTQDKSTVVISRKFVAFSEYMNFNFVLLQSEILALRVQIQIVYSKIRSTYCRLSALPIHKIPFKQCILFKYKSFLCIPALNSPQPMYT